MTAENTGSAAQGAPDLREPSEHMAHIREVFDPHITHLVKLLNGTTEGEITWNQIRKWRLGTEKPEGESLRRIVELSQAADAFVAAKVICTPAMLEMLTFKGKNLLDLIIEKKLTAAHIKVLIREARNIDAAFEDSGLTTLLEQSSASWEGENK